MTAYLFSQGWNNTVTTTINEPNLVKMDLFSNKDGNHIIIQNSNSTNSIKYYLLNSAGTVVRSSTIETSGNAEFPNISGDNDKVYLVYKLGSNLKAHYTTNAGQSWNSVTPRAIGSSTCNGVDIVYDYQGLHVVYATKDSDPNYETYYYKLNSSNNWVDYKNVTDHSIAQFGGRPSISLSSERVHVSFNTSYFDEPYTPGNSLVRDRVNGVWDIPQSVVSGSEETVKEMLLVRDNTLYLFYAKYIMGSPIRNDLVYRTRNVSGSNWSNPTTIATSIEESGNAFNITKTSNNNVHIVFYPEYVGQQQGLVHRVYNGSSWSSPVLLDNNPSYSKNFGLSSVSNDTYLCFLRSDNNFLRYKQFDQAPLAPQNLTVTRSPNNRPLLQWSRNNEADIQHYKIYKYKDPTLGWVHYATTTSTIFEDINETISPIPVANEIWIYYRITAVDYYPIESSHSNQVGIKVIGSPLDKLNIGSGVNEYSLFQNHPNPFNPTTKITWQSPISGHQTLKVYDVLGREVAILVDEYRETGRYEIEFDGTNLPSGMYIYQLQSGSYAAVKKMILSK